MEATRTLPKKNGIMRENRKWLCMPYGLFLILFIIFPILLIFAYAFTDANGVFTFDNFISVFQPDSSGTTFKVIGQSLGVAALTTVICILIAYPIAYILANSKFNKNVVLVYLFAVESLRFSIDRRFLHARANRARKMSIWFLMSLENIEDKTTVNDRQLCAAFFGEFFKLLDLASIEVKTEVKEDRMDSEFLL